MGVDGRFALNLPTEYIYIFNVRILSMSQRGQVFQTQRFITDLSTLLLSPPIITTKDLAA